MAATASAKLGGYWRLRPFLNARTSSALVCRALQPVPAEGRVLAAPRRAVASWEASGSRRQRPGRVPLGITGCAVGLAAASAAASAGRKRGASCATAAASASGAVLPPVAARRPTTVLIGKVDGENRGGCPIDPPVQHLDPLYWLRDDSRSNEEVLEHLRAENAYTKDRVEHLQEFRTLLNRELRGHLQETDREQPLPRGPFEYYRRTVEGLSYSIHCRRPRGAPLADAGDADDAVEQVLLDENKLASGHKYCSVDEVEPSPTHQLLAYTADFSGFETYDLYIRDLSSTDDTDKVPELRGVAGFAWGAADDSEIYYTTHDDAHRPYAVWRHVLGTPQENDVRVFTDDDERFYVSVHRSRDGAMVFLESGSSETSEVHYINLTAGAGAPLQCVHERRPGVLYSVDHRDGTLFIITNEGSQRNQVLRQCKLGSQDWQPVLLPDGDGRMQEVLPHSEQRSLKSVYTFQNFVAISGRENGLTQVWMLDSAGLHRVAWPDDAYSCSVESDTEFSSTSLRLYYSTLVLPRTDVAYHVAEQRLEVLRTKPVPNYDPSLYATARISAKATDGTEIPISLLWRRELRSTPEETDKKGDQSARKVHLYGYGSYGASVEPSFSATRLPLVDRGMVYAIAHVRGGGEMGRWKWYEEGGKYLQKKNTFTDFVACAEHLLGSGWASSPRDLSIEGRSAGGLLVGAALNLRPDLFGAVLAGVPFVDVLVTMSDPSIPLTCGEWEEWGNPNEAKFHEYMRSYSPIDNIQERPYPSVLVTAGLHDPRVAFWEPAKYVQVLRSRRTNAADDGTEVLLKMDLETGHFSASDRYKYLEETAFDQAWLLSQMGLGP